MHVCFLFNKTEDASGLLPSEDDNAVARKTGCKDWAFLGLIYYIFMFLEKCGILDVKGVTELEFDYQTRCCGK